MRLTNALVLALILVVVNISLPEARMVGGWTTIDLSHPDDATLATVNRLSAACVAYLNSASNSIDKFTFARALSLKVQVVAGLNYQLEGEFTFQGRTEVHSFTM